MSTDYASVEQWNDMTNSPIADKEWGGEDVARDRYRSRRLDVVPGFVLTGKTQQSRLSSPWVLTAWSEGVSASTSKPTVDRLSMDQVDVSGNWLDLPAIGEWGPLIHPGAGSMPGTPA